MPKTATPAPLTDGRYWRWSLAAVHPDQDAGDHEVFLFLTAVREYVEGTLEGTLQCSCKAPPGSRTGYAANAEEAPERIPYDSELGEQAMFADLTCRALRVGRDVGEPYARVLGLLVDCAAHNHGRAVPRQSRGASYRQLARIAHTAGFSKEERRRWYEIAESIPLSDHHTNHVINRQGDRKRAA